MKPMRIACFDCYDGASGDMILGALLDVGLPLGEAEAHAHGVPVETSTCTPWVASFSLSPLPASCGL